MSLEQALFQIAEALAANTAALSAHTAALTSAPSNIAVQSALDVADEQKAEQEAKPTATKATPAKKPAPVIETKVEEPAGTPTVVETAPVEAETVVASPSDTPPSLAELTTATTQAATRNREALVELIASFGVKRAGSIPETQWADFIAKAEAL